MQVHLIDGTYELFRHHFALPSRVNDAGREIAAVRGVARSMLTMLEDGATHVAIATDHVIKSFRNRLYDGYKDGSDIDADLHQQFPLLEELLEALGFPVYPMVEHEADDGLAALARIAAADDRVERVLICTPDKDLGQAVGGKIVQFDRRKQLMIDRDEVIERFGVPPESIPDYLGLVGDSADGFPGLAGWGAKSTATVLARYGRIEDIPADSHDWDITVRGASKLALTLKNEMDDALLFRELATLVDDCVELTDVDALRWSGPTGAAAARTAEVEDPSLLERVRALAKTRA